MNEKAYGSDAFARYRPRRPRRRLGHLDIDCAVPQVNTLPLSDEEANQHKRPRHSLRAITVDMGDDAEADLVKMVTPVMPSLTADNVFGNIRLFSTVCCPFAQGRERTSREQHTASMPCNVGPFGAGGQATAMGHVTLGNQNKEDIVVLERGGALPAPLPTLFAAAGVGDAADSGKVHGGWVVLVFVLVVVVACARAFAEGHKLPLSL